MKYLILSYHKGNINPELALWWAPDCAGYTVDVDKAGRYSATDCAEVVKRGDAILIPEAEVLKRTRQAVPLSAVFNEVQTMKKAQRAYFRKLK